MEKFEDPLYVDYHDANATAGTWVRGYTGDDGSYSTTAITNRAVEIIDQYDNSKPLFLYLSYFAPHGPIQVRFSIDYSIIFEVNCLIFLANILFRVGGQNKVRDSIALN